MSTRIVDARGLEPPEPFERARGALAERPPGGQFPWLTDRSPHPLLRILERAGYRHEAGFRDDGAVEILISRP